MVIVCCETFGLFFAIQMIVPIIAVCYSQRTAMAGFYKWMSRHSAASLSIACAGAIVVALICGPLRVSLPAWMALTAIVVNWLNPLSAWVLKASLENDEWYRRLFLLAAKSLLIVAVLIRIDYACFHVSNRSSELLSAVPWAVVVLALFLVTPRRYAELLARAEAVITATA